MKPFHVFVEGPTDKAFIQEALIRFGFGRNNDDRVTAFKGWTALVNTEVQRRLDDGDTILVIFDADDPTRERGGFRNRLQAIREKLGSDLSDRVHIYLFPDNHSDGDLESVLAGLVPARHKTVIDECWTGYERCLTSKG